MNRMLRFSLLVAILALGACDDGNPAEPGRGGQGNPTGAGSGSTGNATGTGSSSGGGTCSGMMTSCGGVCVDTKSDSSHCGACGNACTDGMVCSQGECKY